MQEVFQNHSDEWQISVSKMEYVSTEIEDVVIDKFQVESVVVCDDCDACALMVLLCTNLRVVMGQRFFIPVMGPSGFVENGEEDDNFRI